MKPGDTITLKDGTLKVVDDAFITLTEAVRSATVDDFAALGKEDGEADALQSCAEIVVSGLDKAQKNGSARFYARVARLRDAGAPEDLLDAYSEYFTATSIRRMRELTT